MNLICLVGALVCFILATLDVHIEHLNMIALGLCFYIGACLFGVVPSYWGNK